MKKYLVYLFTLGTVCALSSCATPRYLKKVKLVSYTKDPNNGKSMSTLKGEDCLWKFFDKWELGKATIGSAIEKARTGSGDIDELMDKKGEAADYLKNVRSEFDNSNYIIVQKSCFIVSGTGFKQG